MAEPKDGQAEKTPAETQTPKAPGTGDGNTPQESGLTLDAVQKYLADHPEDIGNLKIGGVKVDGAETEIHHPINVPIFGEYVMLRDILMREHEKLLTRAITVEEYVDITATEIEKIVRDILILDGQR